MVTNKLKVAVGIAKDVANSILFFDAKYADITAAKKGATCKSKYNTFGANSFMIAAIKIICTKTKNEKPLIQDFNILSPFQIFYCLYPFSPGWGPGLIGQFGQPFDDDSPHAFNALSAQWQQLKPKSAHFSFFMHNSNSLLTQQSSWIPLVFEHDWPNHQLGAASLPTPLLVKLRVSFTSPLNLI